MPSLRETLEGRWQPHWATRPSFRRVSRAFDQVRGAWRAVDAASGLREKLTKEGRLSAKGIEEAIRDNLETGVVGRLRRGQHEVAKVRAEIAATRAGMGIPKPDKTDAAGAILRSEYRTFLRQVGMAEASKLLLDPNADPALLEAAWEVPAPMIGLDESIRENLRSAILDRTHAEEIAILDELGEAAVVVEGALTGGLQDIAGLAGFRSANDREFQLWVTAATREIDREIEAETKRAPGLTPIDLKATADAIREMTNEQKAALFDFSIDSQIASITGRPQPDSIRIVEQV
jgi:hypothetical protein